MIVRIESPTNAMSVSSFARVYDGANQLVRDEMPKVALDGIPQGRQSSSGTHPGSGDIVVLLSVRF